MPVEPPLAPREAIPVFTSSINTRSKVVHRRAREGSTSAGTGSLSGTSGWDATFANGWKEDTHDEDQTDDPWSMGASGSRSPKAAAQSLKRQASTISQHPLRHSDDDGGPPRSPYHTLRRTQSDDSTNDSGYSWNSYRKGKGKAVEDETDVIVHQVVPTDSLAGVAVKYGVDIADLRKANKLWAADTIHLRRTLLIPLQSRKFKSTAAETLISLDALPTSSSDLGSESSKPGLSNNSHSSDLSYIPPLGVAGTATIRRVPTTQLSFFPPPTTQPPLPQEFKSQTMPSRNRKRPPLPLESDSSSSPFNSLYNNVFNSPLDPMALASPTPSTPPPQSTSMVPSSIRGMFASPRNGAMTSPRISMSSEDSELPDVELDLLGNGLNFGPREARRRKVTKNPIAVQDIDWTPSVPATNPSTLKPISMQPVRTQQPRPSPKMMVPVANAE